MPCQARCPNPLRSIYARGGPLDGVEAVDEGAVCEAVGERLLGGRVVLSVASYAMLNAMLNATCASCLRGHEQASGAAASSGGARKGAGHETGHGDAAQEQRATARVTWQPLA